MQASPEVNIKKRKHRDEINSPFSSEDEELEPKKKKHQLQQHTAVDAASETTTLVLHPQVSTRSNLFLSSLAEDALSRIVFYLKSRHIYAIRSTGDANLWWRLQRVIDKISIRSNNVPFLMQLRPFVRSLNLTCHESPLDVGKIFSNPLNLTSIFPRLKSLSLTSRHLAQLRGYDLCPLNCPSLTELDIRSYSLGETTPDSPWEEISAMEEIVSIRGLKSLKFDANVHVRARMDELADLLDFSFIETLIIPGFILMEESSDHIALLPSTLTTLSMTINIELSCFDFTGMPSLQSLTLSTRRFFVNNDDVDPRDGDGNNNKCSLHQFKMSKSSDFHVVLPPSLTHFDFTERYLHGSDTTETILHCIREQCPLLRHLRLGGNWLWSEVEANYNNDRDLGSKAMSLFDLLSPDLITCDLSHGMLKDVNVFPGPFKSMKRLKAAVLLPKLQYFSVFKNAQFDAFVARASAFKSLTFLDMSCGPGFVAQRKISPSFNFPASLTKLSLAHEILLNFMESFIDGSSALSRATSLKELHFPSYDFFECVRTKSGMFFLLDNLPPSLKVLHFKEKINYIFYSNSANAVQAGLHACYTTFSWRQWFQLLSEKCPKLRSLHMVDYVLPYEELQYFPKRLKTLEFTIRDDDDVDSRNIITMVTPRYVIDKMKQAAAKQGVCTLSMSMLPRYLKTLTIGSIKKREVMITDLPPHLERLRRSHRINVKSQSTSQS